MNAKVFSFLSVLFLNSVAFNIGAATLSISPPSLPVGSNGFFTLTAGGLTPGQAVFLEQVFDFNSNNAADPGEPITQRIPLTDGQVSLIGGVRNANVPGDEDGATNGQIVAVLNLSVFSEVNSVAARYLYRILSTSGSPLASANFTISQLTFGQGVTGRVTSGAAGVPYTLVALVDGPDGEIVVSALTDSNGNFSLSSAPGSFPIIAVKNGLLFNFESPPMVTISTGLFSTQNLAMTSTDRSINGRVTDASNGAGIAGVHFFVGSSNGFGTALLSDTNGNFSIGITSAASEWEIETTSRNAAMLGYLPGNDFRVNTSTGSINNLSIIWSRPNAMAYGQLRNQQGTPLVGIEISGNQNNLDSSGFTDTNGNYSLPLSAGDDWFFGPENEQLAPLGYSANGTNMSLTTGQAVRVNFTAQALTVRLGGRVVNAAGNPIGNIQLIAFDQMGGNFSGRTDDNGNFNIGLVAGTWNLQLEMEDAASRGLIGPSLVFSNLVDGANITNILYQAQNVTAYITGQVRQTNSSPIAFVNVFANQRVNGTNYFAGAQTDGSGNYSMGVFNGIWSAGVSGNDLSDRGFETPPNQNVTVSGSNVLLNFIINPIQPLQITTTSLPPGVVSQNYHTNLQATGGQPPYDWRLVSGTLPPGVIFDSGLLDGIATGSGTFNFTVQVTDQRGTTTNKSYSITINPSGSNPAPFFLSFGKNPNSRFEMLIQGVVGRSYRFEGSSTLISNGWSFLQTSGVNPGDGRVYFQDTNSPSFNYRFYRAVLLP